MAPIKKPTELAKKNVVKKENIDEITNLDAISNVDDIESIDDTEDAPAASSKAKLAASKRESTKIKMPDEIDDTLDKFEDIFEAENYLQSCPISIDKKKRYLEKNPNMKKLQGNSSFSNKRLKNVIFLFFFFQFFQ